MAIIDSADLFVGYSGGNVTLRRCKNFKPTDASTREGFIPVGSKRPVGSMLKPGEQGFDLEEAPDTSSEVPWRPLFNSGELFTFTVQYRAGATLGERWQYSVQVGEVIEPEGDQGGEFNRTIKLLVIGEGRRLA